MTGATKMKLKIFLFTGLSFAALSQGFYLLVGEGFLPWKFFLNFLFFGGVMTLVLWKTYKKQLEKDSKEFNRQNLNVYQEQIIEVDDFSEEKLLEKIKSHPHFSESKIEETNRGFKLKTPITWKSWGEIVLVEKLQEEENEQKLRIVSYPALSTTIIDYGKNLQNIDKLQELIKTT